MANMPSPDKQAVTYRLHRDLVERVKATAEQQDETVTALVTRALETEIERGEQVPRTTATGRRGDLTR